MNWIKEIRGMVFILLAGYVSFVFAQAWHGQSMMLVHEKIYTNAYQIIWAIISYMVVRYMLLETRFSWLAKEDKNSSR
jgi:hypothetical protein